MSNINLGRHWMRWAFGALVLAAGLLSNLASNFVPMIDDVPQETCSPGSERVTLAGSQQTGIAGAPLGRALVVTVACSPAGGGTARPMEGISVTWSAGTGSVNGTGSAQTLTDYNGRSQVHWTMGPGVGSQSLGVSVLGQTWTFMATALVPTAGGTCTGGPGTDFENERRVVGGETWTRAGSPYRGKAVALVTGATLQIEAGVRVCLQSVTVESGARVQAEGTALSPIELDVADPGSNQQRWFFGGNSSVPANPSVLRHVLAINVPLGSFDHALQIEDSRFTVNTAMRAQSGCVQVRLTSTRALSALSASRIQRTVFDGYGGSAASCEAGVVLNSAGANVAGPSSFDARVTLALGDGVWVGSPAAAPGWALQDCDITSNGRHGVVFDAASANPLVTHAGATVAGCSISSNGRLGIDNRQANLYTVHARGNWWGDAAGPAGANGDGVSQGVDSALPLLAAPARSY